MKNMDKPTIVLTSDFGLDDVYVGVMKGIITNIAPQVQILDLTHSINPQNYKQAAFLLSVSVKHFPKNSIFLTVIDPGVGTARNSIVVGTKDYTFISPDNGTLSYVLQQYTPTGIYSISREKYFLNEISATFHGRDIFAPVAAHIANGLEISELGERISTLSLITIPDPQCFLDGQNIWHGEVLHIDRFGNIITSLKAEYLDINPYNFSKQELNWMFETGNIKIRYLSQTFADVNIGEFLAYVGSFGYIEIAKREGNAAKELGIIPGQNVYAWKF